MDEENPKAIVTPANEFPEKKQELFNLFLKMPVEFKADWLSFREQCKARGLEFEDALGCLIVQFNKGEIPVEKALMRNERQEE
jgi:hypothetical protein